MRERGRARAHRGVDEFEAGVGVAEADFYAERDGEFDRGEDARAFRRDGEEQGIVARECAQFVNGRRRGITHERGIVRADKAGLVRQERPLNVPADDGRAQFRRRVAEGFEFAQLSRERAPLVRDEREQIARATGLAQRARGGEQARGGLPAALEINARVAVHLEIPERGRDPHVVARGGGVVRLDRGDDTGVAAHDDGRAGGVVAGVEFEVRHEAEIDEAAGAGAAPVLTLRIRGERRPVRRSGDTAVDRA